MPTPPDPIERRPIPHTEMPRLPGAKRLRETNPKHVLSVTVALRSRPGAPPLPDARHWMRLPPGRRRFLTPALLAEHLGASPDDADVLAIHLKQYELAVDSIDLAARVVRATGTVEAMARAFGVAFHDYEYHPPRSDDDQPADPSQSGAKPRRRPITPQIFRGYTGAVTLPARVADAVQAVLGLSSLRLGGANMPPPPSGFTLPGIQFSAIKIMELYRFPPADALGQTVAIVAVNGGTSESAVRDPVDYYFGTWLPTLPGGTAFQNPGANLTFHPNGTGIAGIDHETVMDVCIATTVAQRARFTVYQYANLANEQAAWLDALNQVIADNPPVVCTSFYLRSSDTQLSSSALSLLSEKFRALAALGATVFVASGDGGSAQVETGATIPASDNAAVQYPASDPWVTSCGGTTLGTMAGGALVDAGGAAWAEIVWNDSESASAGGGASGGGVSGTFPCPPWQLDAGLTPASPVDGGVRRGVPDVAGCGSHQSRYFLYWDDVVQEFASGTSAVPPLYAGLAAILNRRLGYRLGFLNPTLYEHGPAICHDVGTGHNRWLAPGAPTVAGFDAVPGGWDACTGWGSLDGQDLLQKLQDLAATPAQSVRIVLDQVSYARPTGPVTFNAALFVVLEGFTASALGLSPTATTAANVARAPAIGISPTVSGMSITPSQVDWNSAIPPAQPQTITFSYNVMFTNPGAFPTAGGTQIVTLRVDQGGRSDTAPIELVTTAEPYFSNGDISWLSADLRVFKVTAGEADLPGRFQAPSPGATESSALSFIRTAITNLRDGTVDSAAFDSLPTDQRASALAPDPTDADGHRVYNFALARVRYRAPALDSARVRVFFRSFPTMSTGTVYHDPTAPTGNYRTFSDGVPNGKKIALLGIEGGHYTTIPYFAQARVATSASMTAQDDVNNVVSSIPHAPPDAAGNVPEVVTYFGCWLDFNQDTPRFPVSLPPSGQEDGAFTGLSLQSIRQMLAGGHQCLVAEIAFDGGAIPEGASPGTSARLAQRNIAWVDAENPGETGESRRAPHSFEIRGAHKGADPCEPDELMIDWGNVPPCSIARIYLPTLSADEILDLAAKHQATPPFFRYDAHTVWCEARGVVFLPIPQRGGARHPALLSVDLPASIRKGQEYRVVVRQLTSAPIGRAPRRTRPSRRVLGSFQITIPVDKRHVLLPREERTLAHLRLIAHREVPHDPWRAVLARYVQEQEGRVRGLGGDPDCIGPPPGRRD